MFIPLEILMLLNKRFHSNPPFDKVLNGRKLLAKFVGLALYKAGRECVLSRGSDCAIEGPCCLRHRAEGVREAHEMFDSLIEAADEYITGNSAFRTTIQAIQIELKMRVVIEHLSVSAPLEQDIAQCLENLILKYFSGSSYVMEKLASRAAILRDIVRNNGPTSLASILESKYPFSLFESNLRNFLKSINALFPEELLNELIAHGSEIKNKLQRSDSGILSLSRSASNLASPLREAHVAHHPSLVSDYNGPSEKLLADDAKPSQSSMAQPAKKRVRSVMSPRHRPVAPIAAPEATNDRNPFTGVKISGKFFRGVIEPSDERFAEIADGTDTQVKSFIIERARKAAGMRTRGIPKQASATADSSAKSRTIAKAPSLLDRHASAERITWESQQSPVKAAPVSAKRVVVATAPIDSTQNIPSAETISQEPNRPRPQARARRRFTDDEVANLIEGYKRFGNDWKAISMHYKFNDRTNVDLKDKARNLAKHGLI